MTEQPLNGKIIDEIVEILKADEQRNEQRFEDEKRARSKARKRKDLLETICGGVLFVGLIMVALVSVIGVPALIVKLIIALIGR